MKYILFILLSIASVNVFSQIPDTTQPLRKYDPTKWVLNNSDGTGLGPQQFSTPIRKNVTTSTAGAMAIGPALHWDGGSWKAVTNDTVCKHIFVAVEAEEVDEYGFQSGIYSLAGGRQIVCLKCHYVTMQKVRQRDNSPQYQLPPITWATPYSFDIVQPVNKNDTLYIKRIPH